MRTNLQNTVCLSHVVQANEFWFGIKLSDCNVKDVVKSMRAMDLMAGNGTGEHSEALTQAESRAEI